MSIMDDFKAATKKEKEDMFEEAYNGLKKATNDLVKRDREIEELKLKLTLAKLRASKFSASATNQAQYVTTISDALRVCIADADESMGINDNNPPAIKKQTLNDAKKALAKR